MYLSMQTAAVLFAVLAVALIAFRWSVARAFLRASNRTFGSGFEVDGRDASNGRAVVLGVATALVVASVGILYGLF